MSKRTDKLISRILELPGIESVSSNGEVKLIDGRIQVSLIVYFEKFQETLGVHVKEEVGTEDIFGG